MKLMIGLPWYVGPDNETFPLYFDQMSYYGALRERSVWRDVLGHERFMEILPTLPPLDETKRDEGRAEPTEADWKALGRIELAVCNYSLSLIGRAREMIVDTALEWKADYLFWWDADMRFEYSTLLRLWRHQKPVVGALAFTARHPIFPVIYSIRERWDTINGAKVVESSEPVLDYPRDQLIGNSEVGGELAMGGAVVLYDMRVFKEIPKPWFSSTGCGEDWFFCHRCTEYAIPRFVDTGVKTQHKEHAARWADEEAYWRERELLHSDYVADFGDLATRVRNGEVAVSSVDGKPLSGVLV